MSLALKTTVFFSAINVPLSALKSKKDWTQNSAPSAAKYFFNIFFW